MACCRHGPNGGCCGEDWCISEEETEVECSCEYPHGHDFEPPFETCTCVPDCFHIVPLNLEAIMREERVNIGESGLVIEQQDRDFDKLVAERDAAIERGVELWEVLYHYTLHSSTVRRLLEQVEAKINKLRPSGWGQV